MVAKTGVVATLVPPSAAVVVGTGLWGTKTCGWAGRANRWAVAELASYGTSRLIAGLAAVVLFSIGLAPVPAAATAAAAAAMETALARDQHHEAAKNQKLHTLKISQIQLYS